MASFLKTENEAKSTGNWDEKTRKDAKCFRASVGPIQRRTAGICVHFFFLEMKRQQICRPRSRPYSILGGLRLLILTGAGPNGKGRGDGKRPKGTGEQLGEKRGGRVDSGPPLAEYIIHWPISSQGEVYF